MKINFNVQCIGDSHLKSNKPCQDAVFSKEYDTYSIIVVCDGHGSDDYIRSDRGSRLAVEATDECINEFMSHCCEFKDALTYEYDTYLARLEKSIIAKWREKVHFDVENDPFNDAELSEVSQKAYDRYTNGKYEKAYGTTLITFVICDEFCFGLQQGDGKCIVINGDGTFTQPIPWDNRCFENVTTSMCDEDASNGIRHYFSTIIPTAVFVASDGVDDSFAREIDMNGLYKQIIITFTQKGYDTAIDELREALPTLSKLGSGDDISIAGIIDSEQANNLAEAFQNQLDTRNKEIAEANRIERAKKESWLQQFGKEIDSTKICNERTEVSKHSYNEVDHGKFIVNDGNNKLNDNDSTIDDDQDWNTFIIK